MMDTFGKENRYRPLLSVSTNQHGVLLVETALKVGDESSFTFHSKDLKVIPGKHRIIADERLTELYNQLLTPEMDLMTFLQTSLAYTGHILK